MALKANYQGIKKVKRPLDLTTEGTLSAKVANSIEDEDTSALIPLSIAQMLASNIGIVNTKKADITAIGDDESGRTTASRAYSAGEYFYKDGQNCRTKTVVASGATWTLNTNYEVKSIDSAISVIEGTITPTTGITLNTSSKLIKQGSLVNLNGMFQGVSCEASTDVLLGSVPDGYKPSHAVNTVGVTSTATEILRITIGTSGNIYLYSGVALSSKTIDFNVVYDV